MCQLLLYISQKWEQNCWIYIKLTMTLVLRITCFYLFICSMTAIATNIILIYLVFLLFYYYICVLSFKNSINFFVGWLNFFFLHLYCISCIPCRVYFLSLWYLFIILFSLYLYIFFFIPHYCFLSVVSIVHSNILYTYLLILAYFISVIISVIN